MNQEQKKPFSQACENNKQPILDVISEYFKNGVILEVGSGTGQHAMFFAEHMRHIYWQTSDRVENLPGINVWLNAYTHYNLGRPMILDVNQDNWPMSAVDGVFTANTLHIMNWSSVEELFHRAAEILRVGGYFCAYGPVNIDGEFTSESNRAFDAKLRDENPSMGIRDLDDLKTLGEKNNLNFINLHRMPANNVTMIWQKQA